MENILFAAALLNSLSDISYPKMKTKMSLVEYFLQFFIQTLFALAVVIVLMVVDSLSLFRNGYGLSLWRLSCIFPVSHRLEERT